MKTYCDDLDILTLQEGEKLLDDPTAVGLNNIHGVENNSPQSFSSPHDPKNKTNGKQSERSLNNSHSAHTDNQNGN